MARITATERKRQMKALRRLIDSSSDPIQRRIAYAMEIAVNRVTLSVHGWPTLANEAELLAKLLREDLAV